MTVTGILWIVLSPYCTGAVVAWVRPVNRAVCEHLLAAVSCGWAALATVIGSVFVIGDDLGMAIAALVAPIAGFAFWIPRRGRDDEPGPPKPEPPRDEVDWDSFDRARRDWDRDPAGLR